jgi:hypothetical protein
MGRRRDALAAREEQLGRCAAEQSKYYRLYLHSFKLAFAAIYHRRVRVACPGFAAAPTHDSTVLALSGPAAKKLGVGLRRPCRGQTLGFMLGALARVAPARLATPPNGLANTYLRNRPAFINSASMRNLGGG